MTANFRSDNETPVAPAIMEAILEANRGTAWAYAEDDWSNRLDQAFSELFRTQAIVLPVSTGTVANSIALATVTPPWGSVFCHSGAHIQNDECGAPEFFGNGMRLVPVKGENGKLQPAAEPIVPQPFERHARAIGVLVPGFPGLLVVDKGKRPPRLGRVVDDQAAAVHA